MNKKSLLKVLIVDEKPLIVEEISQFLQRNGYACVPCSSSTEALDTFRSDPAIGIVLCDLDTQELNGIELVERMRQVAGKKHAFEAIMLTDRVEKQVVIKALRAGIADYYQKPLNLEELLEGVQRQEAALKQRQKSYHQLGDLHEKLRFLAASIDDLYQDLDKVRHPSLAFHGDEDDAELDPATLFAPLSPRQQDVARLVAKGHTNYQIGCELGITENTVKLYVSQVLRLTHMHNRTQLALALSPNTAQRQRMTAH